MSLCIMQLSQGAPVHSDGPECGCWNLIYASCSASDGHSMGSAQEMSLKL